MGNVVRLAKHKGIATWWEETEVRVLWSADRHPGLPVLEATGEIFLWGEDDEEEPTASAGTISIAKPCLWADADCQAAVDDISGDCGLLAAAVLDGPDYSDEFHQWFEVTFGVLATGNPVFIHDIEIQGGFRNPQDPLAAYAVLEAAAAFGSPGSPIIGFSVELVGEHIRDQCRNRGLWDWVDPLNAQTWRGVLVAARPQPGPLTEQER